MHIKMGLSFGQIISLKLNCRWPVPMPCWRNPDYVDEDKSDDDDVFDPKSGRTLRYGYFKGKKVMLF